MTDFFYSDYRLKLPYWVRFAVRFLTYAGGALLVATGFVLCLSDIIWLRIVSLVILAMLAYYLLLIGKPRRSLKKVSPLRPNIASYTSSSAYRLLELALDRTALQQTDFILNLLCELLKAAGPQKAVAALPVEPAEFIAKAESRRRRSTHNQTKAELFVDINKLMIAALEDARATNANSISSVHLWRALLRINVAEVVKVFEIFGKKPADALH